MIRAHEERTWPWCDSSEQTDELESGKIRGGQGNSRDIILVRWTCSAKDGCREKNKRQSSSHNQGFMLVNNGKQLVWGTLISDGKFKEFLYFLWF